jgi:hypothetical protein
MPPDRAGEGAPPKSLIFATAGGRPAPKFLIIWPTRRRGQVPQKRHGWRFARLAVSPGRRSPLGIFDTEAGQGEERPVPQILHTWLYPGRQQSKLRHHSSRLQARGQEIRFPQKPHSWWRIFNARKRCFAAVSRLRRRPASEQGRGVEFPHILHTCICRQAGRWPLRRPQISHNWLPPFSYLSRRRQRFPQNLHNTAPDPSFYSPNPS